MSEASLVQKIPVGTDTSTQILRYREHTRTWHTRALKRSQQAHLRAVSPIRVALPNTSILSSVHLSSFCAIDSTATFRVHVTSTRAPGGILLSNRNSIQDKKFKQNFRNGTCTRAFCCEHTYKLERTQPRRCACTQGHASTHMRRAAVSRNTIRCFHRTRRPLDIHQSISLRSFECTGSCAE